MDIRGRRVAAAAGRGSARRALRLAAIPALALWLGAFSGPFPGASQEDGGWSKQMRSAVEAYEAGKDTEAMDRFMEILVHGRPEERAGANEYLNLITRRMGAGKELPKSSPAIAAVRWGSILQGGDPSRGSGKPRALPPEEAEAEKEGVAADAPGEPREAARLPEGTPRPPEEELPRWNKAVMKREIESRIRSRAAQALGELEKMDSVRVIPGDPARPRAIGIPAGLLFQSGVVFRQDAGTRRLLNRLVGLIVSLGGAQVAVLPEGATTGDAKILDMRRTMAISSHLYSMGVAPPRIRVNLIQSQIDLPRGLGDFRGIIVLFLYGKPLSLSAERVTEEESGPPVSMGVFPERFKPSLEEGTIVEFAVLEPPSGLLSWKFQLLQPGRDGGETELSPLQEVAGGLNAKPVFHQLYWNGRRNYFGQLLPPGRYEAVLTATDGRRRTRTLRRWITLEESGPLALHRDSGRAAAVAPLSREPARPARARGTAPPPRRAASAARKAAPTRKTAPRARTGDGGPSGRRALPARRGRPDSAGAAFGRGVPAARPAPKTAQARRPERERPDSPLHHSAQPPARPAPAPAPDRGAPPPAGSRADGAVSYRLVFITHTQSMTQDGERRLAQVAETMTYYPMENLNLVGYAGSGESDPELLARNRAKLVSQLLVDKYNIDPRRVHVESKVVGMDRPEVEIYIVAGKE